MDTEQPLTDDLDWKNERTRVAHYQANIAEIREAKLKEELVTRQEAEDGWELLTKLIDKRFDGIAPQLAPQLKGIEDVKMIQRLIADAIRVAKTDLAETDLTEFIHKDETSEAVKEYHRTRSAGRRLDGHRS